MFLIEKPQPNDDQLNNNPTGYKVEKNFKPHFENASSIEADQAQEMQQEDPIKAAEETTPVKLTISQKNDEEDCKQKSVTVVEHDQGFKYKAEFAPNSQLHSSTSRTDDEPMMLSSDKMISGIGSEKSKPLSPMTSQRMSPHDRAFDYKPNTSQNQLQSSITSKASVKFKEETEDSISVNKETKEVTNLKNVSLVPKKQNSKPKNITSILKTSARDKNSSANRNDSSIGDDTGSIYDEPVAKLKNQKFTSKDKKNKIKNMCVEEDQVNLSDLGNGPDKPTIKTIVRKSEKASHRVADQTDSSKSNKSTPMSSKSKASYIQDSEKNREEAEGESEYEEEDSDKSVILEDSAFEDYKMKSDLFDFDEIKQSELFKVKKYKDAIYRGWLDPETYARNGFGVMEYDNGRVYEGSWENDLRTGKGYEMYSNRNLYQGEFLRGKAHGKGHYQWANGEFYDGAWIQGQKDGYGEWKSHDDETYIGHWKEGKASGKGCYTWKNGDKYDGEWLQCLKHGKGQDQFANGDSYTGQYRYGKPWGVGIYMWKN